MILVEQVIIIVSNFLFYLYIYIYIKSYSKQKEKEKRRRSSTINMMIQKCSSIDFRYYVVC